MTWRITKHLILNGGSENWRLPDGTDIDVLRRTIEHAMQTGHVLQVPVYLADRPDAPVTLFLNAAAAPSVEVVEL